MSERTDRLEAIFHAAAELSSAAQRADYLDAACEGDPNLRREVEAFLKAIPVGEDMFQSCEQARSPGANNQVLSDAERIGSSVGRYKLLEKIGEGGMGVVYLAEQREPVTRKVAIKIIKLGMDTRQVVARFEAERQALALMDHPNIAQVLDGGATDTGRPYFVMELVQGVPITEFCEANQLSVEERLKQFIAVCQAIQSAHQKGIIHRDIKPSNVLVTLHNGDPHPMVIDFGVAKATGEKLTEKTLFTNVATMIGTPAYMSPEQAEMSKLDVDTRSDIYSLGVLLYELVTGTTPFPEERLRSVAYAEMQRIIAEEEPERPSTRLKKRRAGSATPIITRHSSFATDLDWIVMKCLEKDRNRRYETANGLAADLNRYLNDEPVIARPPSAAYRFRKLIRRHRTASIAALLIILALLSGIGVSTWALIRERNARHQADLRLRAALTFVDEMFTQVAPRFHELPGAANAQARLGQAGLSFLNQLQSTAAIEDPDIAVTMGRALATISEWQNPGRANTLGNYEAGIQQAEQALAILAKPSLPMSESERARLQALASFGRIQCLYALGRMDETVAFIPQADSFYAQMERFPEHVRFAARMRVALTNNAGYALTLAGRPAEALERFLLPALSSALATRVKTNLADADQFELESYMHTHANVATAYLFQRQPMAMPPYVVESLRVAEHLVKRMPSSGRYMRKQASVMAVAGYAFIGSSEIDRGMEFLNSSRASVESLTAKEPENEASRYARANITAVQAMAYARLSENASIAASERRKYLAQAEAYRIEAEEFARMARTKEPEFWLKAARAEVAIAFEANPPETSDDFEKSIQATAAVKGWPAAAEICRKNFDRIPDSLWIWLNKAWIFRYVSDEDSYRRVVEKALVLSANGTSTNDQHIPIEIAALGSLQFSAAQLKQLEAMIDALEAALPARPADLQAWGYRAVAQMQLRLGRLDRCLVALEKSASQQTTPESYNLFIKATCLHRLGHPDEARAAFNQADSLLKPLPKQSSQEPERFLRPWDIFQQVVMRREAKALLDVK